MSFQGIEQKNKEQIILVPIKKFHFLLFPITSNLSFFRYIPENFYSDFTISDQNNASANAVVTQASTGLNSNRLPDYLETVVAAAGKNPQQASQATQNLLNAQTQPLSQSTVLQV